MNDAALASSLDLKNKVRQTSPGTIIELQFIRQNIAYHARVEVGKLQVASPQELLAESNRRAPGAMSTDSLLNEVRSLKRAIYYLEKRLNGLK
jgi:ubiquinone biosynthesis protein UbiJ